MPYAAIARHILGPRYELSLVVCGDALARRMFRAYRAPAMNGRAPREKTYASNVLSFPLAADAGELFLNVRKAAREARALGTTPRKRAALLFVHGCYHLKGMTHGDAMERAERAALRRFDLQ